MKFSESIPSPSFSGHESFTLRFAWLPKAVQGILRHRDLFEADDALVHLGVGKNMVRSIRHWSVLSGFLEETPKGGGQRSSRPTATLLGTLLFGRDGLDPYLEDPATLWLVHWQLSSRKSGPTTWYWVFNEFAETEFTKEKLCASLRNYIDKNEWKRIADNTIERDVDCFLRTYIPRKRGRTEIIEESLDCPLTELGLLDDVEDLGFFSFNRGDHPSLPLSMVLFSIVDFWSRSASLAKTMSYDQLAYHPGSPGRVFKLSDTALTEYLEGLSDFTKGALRFGTTAGLRQLYRHREMGSDFPATILGKHYGIRKEK